MGQNQGYYFGVGALPMLVYFSGDWDVHWGYGLLTRGHLTMERTVLFAPYEATNIFFGTW